MEMTLSHYSSSWESGIRDQSNIPFDPQHHPYRSEEIGDLFVIFLFFSPFVVSANEDDIKVLNKSANSPPPPPPPLSE